MNSETLVSIDSAVSSRRSETARRNGARSRGPITEEGKRRASQNALKHGMYSPDVLLPNESETELNQLRDEYFAEFSPVGPAERHEVETMTVAEWRIRRFRSMETARLRNEMKEVPRKLSDCISAVALARDVNRVGPGGVQAIYKFEPACQRDYDRALRRLFDLQKHRNEPKRAEAKAAPKPDCHPPQGEQTKAPETAVAASAPTPECAISHCPTPGKPVVEFHPMPPSHHRDGESSPTESDTRLLNSTKQTRPAWPEGCTTNSGIPINDQAKSYDRWK
jgi:hypothetical protein